MSRRVIVPFAMIFVLLGSNTADAYTPTTAERSAHADTNYVRVHFGRRTVVLNDVLSPCAHQHSAAMAAHRTLYHSRCSRFRENVGYGPTLDAIARAYIHSPVHRANLLCGCYHEAVGVVRSGSLYWMTNIYW